VAVDLRDALRQLNEQVGVPMDELVRGVENALAIAYKRQFQPDGFVQARLDRDTGELSLTATRTSEDGTQAVEQLPIADFRRLVAPVARRAVLGQLRGRERLEAAEQWSHRYGQLTNAPVDRIDAQGAVRVDLGHVEGVMGPEDQVPGEELRAGQSITFVTLEPKPGKFPAVRISRAHRLFVQRMLEAEVPEVAAGVVEVKAIAREAGLRTKVAVTSHDPGVDAVGACVGPKGVRHRSLLEDLPGEHLDIVPWSEEAERFVAAALGPATVVAVTIDPDTRTATVLVPKEQLSLAIGRDGQNARLAAKLTGWRIDIHPAPGEADGVESAPDGQEDGQEEL
jgi:transcription termination/antitermination protein NusA